MYSCHVNHVVDRVHVKTFTRLLKNIVDYVKYVVDHIFLRSLMVNIMEPNIDYCKLSVVLMYVHDAHLFEVERAISFTPFCYFLEFLLISS